MENNYPKLHNAMWPGLVGKGPDSEPPIDLDTMLNLTAAADVNGVRFEGVDLFLFDPHVSIDAGSAASMLISTGTVGDPPSVPAAATSLTAVTVPVSTVSSGNTTSTVAPRA